MKKLILILAIALIASPVLALDVALTREGTTNVIDLTYSGADGNNLPRAFALDLTFSTGAQFTGVVSGSYMTGESNQPHHKGYGIYPARISIDSTGVVQNWGTPLADSNVSSPADPGAGGALPSGHMVLEFASLYYDNPAAIDTNAPPTSGTLCKFTVNAGAASNPVITMSDELTYRGGIVLEQGQQDLTAADKAFTYITQVQVAPGKATNPTPANAATQVSVTQVLSWTADTGATSHGVYFGTVSPGTFVGAQAGTSYAPPTMALNKTYYWRIDEINGAGTTTGDVWSFTTECFPNPGSAKYIEWTNVGKPSCWCALVQPRQCHGDADNKNETKNSYWVSSNDLTVLTTAWSKPYTSIKGLTGGTSATPLICADFTHSSETKNSYRVSSLDLTTLTTNWSKAGKPDPNCSLMGY
jgi:hypothetical protein